MGDVLLVWTAAYQTCLMRACVPCLLSDLYQLFDQTCFNRLATHFKISMFGRQTFPVCPGPNVARDYQGKRVNPHIAPLGKVPSSSADITRPLRGHFRGGLFMFRFVSFQSKGKPPML